MILKKTQVNITQRRINATDDFSNLDIAAFVGCYTACSEDGTDSHRTLVHAVVEQGARVAIGFTQNLNCGFANAWTETFINGLLDGKSVKVAAEEACTENIEDPDITASDLVVIVGEYDYTPFAK